MPLSSLPEHVDRVRAMMQEHPGRRVVCLCRRGNDSQRAVVLLEKIGISGCVDVVGGLAELASRLDPTIPIY